MTALPAVIVRGKCSPEVPFLLTIMSAYGAEGEL